MESDSVIDGGDILVTGGSGFIGRYVINSLKDKFKVVVADLQKPPISDIDFVEIDLRNQFKISNDFKYCIHLAGFVGGIQFFTSHPVENIRDNPKITTNIFDACVNSSISHVLYASSSVVYQHQTKFPTTEEDVATSPPPTSAYGMSKLFGEYCCKAYNEQNGLNYTILRPFNAYGPGEAPDPDYAHVIPHLIQKVISGLYPVPIYGDGNQTRTFTYGTDIANAFKISLGNNAALNETFNVSGDEELSIIEVLKRIWNMTKQTKELKVQNLEPLKDDVQRRYPSNEKLKKSLNWKPQTTFDEGLEKTIEWLKQNPS